MMAMAPEVSIDKTSIAPEASEYQRRKNGKKQQRQPSQKPQYLQLPQQSSSSSDYYHYYQNDSDYRNASPSKQQSASSSFTLPSPKLKFRESLRDLYVPKFWFNLRKSASEISLVLEAMRYGPTSSYLQTYGVPSIPGNKIITVGSGGTSKPIRGSAVKRRKLCNALITWQNYSPHHLNKQIRYGNSLNPFFSFIIFIPPKLSRILLSKINNFFSFSTLIYQRT